MAYPLEGHPIVDPRTGRVTPPWLAFFNLLATSAGGGGVALTGLSGPVTTPLGGGVQPTTITPTGVTPGTYGDAANVPQVTVNAAGQVTAAANVAISAGAPTSAEYLVGALSGALSAERLVTNTATAAWDLSTPGQAAVNVPDDAITNAKLRESAAVSVIGRSANSTGNPADIAASADQQILGRRGAVVGFTAIEAFGYWSPLTNGDPVTPELIFAAGDAIAVWTATP
jgi:hypothetical protein